MTAAVHYLATAAVLGHDDQADALDQLRGQLADAQARLAEMRAAFLARSDDRDQWLRRTLTDWADGYRAGFEAGSEVGAARAVSEWKITAANVGLYDVGQHGPSWAELDRRRYRPHGRLSWILPNLGDLWAAWSALGETDGDEAP